MHGSRSTWPRLQKMSISALSRFQLLLSHFSPILLRVSHSGIFFAAAHSCSFFSRLRRQKTYIFNRLNRPLPLCATNNMNYSCSALNIQLVWALSRRRFWASPTNSSPPQSLEAQKAGRDSGCCKNSLEDSGRASGWGECVPLHTNAISFCTFREFNEISELGAESICAPKNLRSRITDGRQTVLSSHPANNAVRTMSAVTTKALSNFEHIWPGVVSKISEIHWAGWQRKDSKVCLQLFGLLRRTAALLFRSFSC